MAAVSLNRNLQQAKSQKNDDFYTQLPDIENELKHYRQHFAGKVV
ncbi:MAG: restriction endonuclease subunit M, partial [Gammaproteobacteria bacterium]|nr:restriction endonuclease subunit M [Gammaproteobacteria bacterium]